MEGAEFPAVVDVDTERALTPDVLSRFSGTRRADSEMSSVIFLSCHSSTTFEVPIETNL
jgi:hypothetical protein